MIKPDFLAHKHPVLAVACPDCKAAVGAWCKRPSGHKASDFHKARKDAADEAWIAAGRPPAAAQPAMTPEDLKTVLAELGWSQIDLARRLTLEGGRKVAGQTIWRYLAGERPVPAMLAAYLRLMLTVERKDPTP